MRSILFPDFGNGQLTGLSVCATVIPICYTVLRPTVNAGHRGELTGQKLCDQRTVGSEHHVTSQEIRYSPINQ